MNAAREDTGWLEGRAVDLAGRPLPGATVHWTGWVDRERRTVTAAADAAGRFRIGPLPAGPDRVLWVEAPGHARLRLGDQGVAEIAVFPEATNDLGDVVLAPERTLSGRVVDEHGVPIAGVDLRGQIHHHTLAHTVGRNGPHIDLVTGDDGRFHIGSLPAGSIRLAFRVPGHPVFHRGGPIDAGGIDLGDIRVVRERREVHGLVVDPHGRPVSGAKVFVNGDRECRAQTDDGGRFTLLARRVEIRSVTVVDHDQASTFPVDDPEDIRVELEPLCFLEGCVLDRETGEPIPIQDLFICEARRREVDGTIEYAG